MAGQKVFIGEIMEEMITKLGTLDTMITELQNVKTAVSQSVTALNVKSGSAVEIDLGNTQKTAANSTVTVATFKSFSRGSVLVSAYMQSSVASYTVTLLYKINGVAAGAIVSTTATVLTLKTGSIPVNPGDTIELYFTVASGYSGVVGANAKIGYEIIDIVNGNGIVVV